MGKRVAIYARVSTTDQNLDGQVDQLRTWAQARGHEVVAEILDHGLSGADSKRPGLSRLLRMATAGEVDVVAVSALDRLGRSLPDLLRIVEEFRALGVELYLGREGIDTATPMGTMFMQMVGAFAEFERAILVERVRSGMARAKAKGKHVGRPVRVTAKKRERILELVREGRSKADVAREVEISRASVYRVIGDETKERAR